MRNKNKKGFTLIELLAVLAIFAVLTSVVVFNYAKFRSETILTNMAYEVALSIREAQIYGVSARNAKNMQSPNFKLPYGIFFIKDSNQYVLFADSNGDNEFTGTSCSDVQGDLCVTPYIMQQNIKITDIQTKTGSTCTHPTTAGILFKRPNPEPIISADSANGYSLIQATLTSADGSNRYVVVYNNGQVAVVNTTQACN